jgi:hypothetical protein
MRLAGHDFTPFWIRSGSGLQHFLENGDKKHSSRAGYIIPIITDMSQGARKGIND